MHISELGTRVGSSCGLVWYDFSFKQSTMVSQIAITIPCSSSNNRVGSDVLRI